MPNSGLMSRPICTGNLIVLMCMCYLLLNLLRSRLSVLMLIGSDFSSRLGVGLGLSVIQSAFSSGGIV